MGMTVSEARSFIKQVALMTRGHDEEDNTDIKGGAGRIGMTADGKVFKFNTHLGERWGGPSKSQDMINSCNRLRDKLLEASQTILLGDDKGAPNSANNNSGSLGNHLDNIRKMLGIKCSENGMSVLKASTERLLDRTVTAKVLNILADESPSANVNALWADVKQGYIKTYTDSKFTVMEDRVTRHVKGISDDPLSVFLNQPEMKDEDIRFTSLVSQCFEKFKLACRRKIENTLAGKSTDMIKFHDNLVGRLNGMFDDLIKKQFSGDDTKTKLLVPLISAAKAEIDSATRQVGQIQYGKILTKDLFDGRTHSVLGDQKLADFIEDVLCDELKNGIKDRGGLDKYIEYLVGKIVGDGTRGNTVYINGKKLPTYDTTEKDPERTRKKTKENVKKILENLCRDPKTGSVDKKSLASMMMLMWQRMITVTPISSENMAGEKYVDDVLPVKLRMLSKMPVYGIITEVTSGTSGEWNVNVKFSAECNELVGTSNKTCYYPSRVNGNKSEIGFETSITFKSGVIGNSSSAGNPTITVHQENTYVSLKLAPLSEKGEVLNEYSRFLDRCADDNQPEFGNLFESFNKKLRGNGKPEMSTVQFKTWIKDNKEELFKALENASDLDKSDYIRNDGYVEGYPMISLKSTLGSRCEKLFENVWGKN